MPDVTAYLTDYLAEEDFSSAVELTGKKLQHQYGLPATYQLGLVVADAVAADQAMAEAGLPHAFLVDVRTDRWVESGKDKQLTARLGFSYHQGYELELIQPGNEAGFYARDIDPQGGIVVHHFGFMISGLENWVARFGAEKVPLLVRGKLRLGIVTGEFAYFDTRGDHGVITELISMKILGIHAKLPKALVARLARFQVASGKRCFSV